MAKRKLQQSPEQLVEFVEGLKHQWMATVDAIVDPLMIVDQNYTIAKANKALAQLANTDVKNILGRKCYEVFSGRQDPCPGCSMQKAAKNGGVHQFNLDHIRQDAFYEVTSQPIYDNNSELTGVLQVYRDRTEARRLEQQLLQNEKLASIGLLAGGIAHEINNPLGGILIFSQMILKELDKNSPHYQDVVEIEAATQRCKQIVESLLDFARQQPSTARKEDLEEVDIKAAVKSALRFGQVGHLAKSIDVHEEWYPKPLTVTGNRNKIIQLFLNLIQNAFQAMPDGGSLTLRSKPVTKDGGSFVVVEVEDTGVGIAAKDLHKIFDPFYTSKNPGEGTGLGLAICYGIAEDLGGTIEVASEVNEGTCFRLVVPQSESMKQTA